MGIVKGIKAINEKLEENSSGTSSTGKARWLQLKDGQTVKLRFVNEISADSPNYDETRDLVAMVKEHTNPKDFKRRAICTMEDEGRCVGCEMSQKQTDKVLRGKWRAKDRFYTNVLVDDGIEDPYVAVWSMGTYKSPTFETIQSFIDDSDSISNLTWKLKRTGEGTETTYSLIPGKVDTEPFDWAGVEPYPIETATRSVPYAEQEKFYLGFSGPAAPTDDNW